MLDGRQAHARRILDHGVQAGVNDGLARHRNAVVAVGDVGAHEDDARAGRGRTHDQLDALAGVNADAGADGRSDDGLFVMVVADRQWKLSVLRGSAPIVRSSPQASFNHDRSSPK